MTHNFQNPNAVSASLLATPNLKFEREDWTSFRTLDGLQQKAGVPKHKLVQLVLKELVDNSLDAGGEVNFGKALKAGGYYVYDDVPDGIDGAPEDIARLFSIDRPMMSSKYLRKPQRGILGNGLRVVAGAVLASEGSLTVTTHNRRIELRPERDGTTTVVKVSKVEFPRGTKIEISFGSALRHDARALDWATTACDFARVGKSYSGKSSPHWYDVPNFHELLSAAGATPVRELMAELDGCTGGKAGEIVDAAGLSRAICKDVNQKQAATLLRMAQMYAKPVTPQRLGFVGQELFPDYAYACVRDTTDNIPFVVEAWATELDKDDDTELHVCVNRTPVTGDINAARDKRDIDVYGCGLRQHRCPNNEGCAIQHLAQHHHAVRANHQRRQRAGPQLVSRRDLRHYR